MAEAKKVKSVWWYRIYWLHYAVPTWERSSTLRDAGSEVQAEMIMARERFLASIDTSTPSSSTAPSDRCGASGTPSEVADHDHDEKALARGTLGCARGDGALVGPTSSRVTRRRTVGQLRGDASAVMVARLRDGTLNQFALDASPSTISAPSYQLWLCPLQAERNFRVRAVELLPIPCGLHEAPHRVSVDERNANGA